MKVRQKKGSGKSSFSKLKNRVPNEVVQFNFMELTKLVVDVKIDFIPNFGFGKEVTFIMPPPPQ